MLCSACAPLPTDPKWVESLNTVLDENKRLCLTSGEIIQMNARQSVLFETADLENASPATVGRCAILFQDPAQLGIEPLLDAWLRHHLPAALLGGPLSTQDNLTPAQQLMQRLSVPGTTAASGGPGTLFAPPPEFVNTVRALLSWLVKPLVQHVTRSCTQLEPLGVHQLTLSFLRLYERLLSDEYKRVGVEDEEMPAANAAASSTGDASGSSPSKQGTSISGARSAGGKSAKAPSRQQTSAGAAAEDAAGSQTSDPAAAESSLLSPEKIREEQANLIVAQFFFCLVWGIGGALHESSLHRFEEFFRILCDADPQNLKFPRYLLASHII